jgi:hypothetical protein
MKYVVLWETDYSKLPADPKQSGAILMKLIEMTKQWLKSKPGADWGLFIGEGKGYSVAEGDAHEVMKSTLMFSPYVKFKVYQVASIDEWEEAFKSTMAMMQSA